MKLDYRDFYYLDNDYVNNLSGHISGFIEEEYSQVEKEAKTNKGKGTTNFGMVKGDLERDSTKGREVTRAGIISPEIRYKNLFDILIDKGLEQIDTFDKHLWDMLVNEDEFIEIRGSIYFTEVYELERQASFIGNLGSNLGFIDKDEAKKVMSQISEVKALQEKDGIPIIIETMDSKYKFVAYLNSKFLVKEQSDIIGNDYKILCKVERRIDVDEKKELFDIQELERRTTNRAERRSKKETLPKEFKQTVVGPAAIILPIAIYR